VTLAAKWWRSKRDYPAALPSEVIGFPSLLGGSGFDVLQSSHGSIGGWLEAAPGFHGREALRRCAARFWELFLKRNGLPVGVGEGFLAVDGDWLVFVYHLSCHRNGGLRLVVGLTRAASN
jgi:hypothetical protein